ncbi:MAG TPA: hypothetical protein VMS76_01995 [Planctomycetota bacterium]|nr:hypothetical protein [Planctomycetota bacterium]
MQDRALQEGLEVEPDDSAFDEDLFNFDELMDDSETALVQLDDGLGADDPPAPATPVRPPPAGGAASVMRSRPAEPATAPQPARTSQHAFRAEVPAEPSDAAPAQTHSPKGGGLLRGEARLVLALAALFNVVLMAFAWRSISSVQALVVQMGDRVIQTTDQIRAETAERAEELARSALPVVAPRPEGLATLDNARAAMERGEFERARAMLYALLAVADRIEPSARRDIEARASFLIADSYRLQAEFVPPASEVER